ncbi:MAG: response regulator transcription factor [Chloroflexota bacterium]
MIRVLICDDQEIVRKGLNIILTHAEGIQVVGLAEDGADCLQKSAELEPDLVLMYLKMPKLNGIQTTEKLRKKKNGAKILVLTTYDADEWVFDAIKAGASGYLLKDTDGDEIVHAIKETAAGRVHLDSRIAGKVLSEFRRINLQATESVSKKPKQIDFEIEKLTEREQSILEQMALGKSNADIAAELFLAEGTIKNNVSQIIQKLHANSRTQAILTALRSGLVDL